MKFPIEWIFDLKKIANRKSQITNGASGFTMMEIAISLAIIGIALVAIIGVLPLGMNVQKDNREQTIVNQDASVFIEAIRNGARGLDDLTNYVYAITNYWMYFPAGGTPSSGVNGYDYGNVSILAGYPLFNPPGAMPINSGTNIIGLLSAPEFMDANGIPLNAIELAAGNFYSNHIVAYVHSISGPAVEKPPQDNPILQQDSFGYRIFCVNAPVPMDTNIFNLPVSNPSRIYSDQLADSEHELCLTFEYPQLPSGNLGSGRQTFRTLVAGQLQQFPLNNNLYFYQSQSFTNAP